MISGFLLIHAIIFARDRHQHPPLIFKNCQTLMNKFQTSRFLCNFELRKHQLVYHQTQKICFTLYFYGLFQFYHEFFSLVLRSLVDLQNTLSKSSPNNRENDPNGCNLSMKTITHFFLSGFLRSTLYITDNLLKGVS